VVGHTFWWEVTYPDLDITTANEIHVPVDQPVRLQLTTEDVIHSFWIPRLHGKVDMIPGTENTLTFTATETGRFRGQCAEFCGIAHAQMVAYVEAQAPDAFDDWVDGQQQDAAAPATAGQEVFLEAGCAACHTVAGTEAVGGVGPDLTHLASRETLAAGIVPNTRDSLAALILDPWGVKPGIAMPPAELDDAQLAALLDYLQELQ
jgi:cytochrome c oxidase subunit 2